MGDHPETKPSKETLAAQERFILEWGRMSSSWGINRTMAQIHALLLVSEKAHTMDEVIDRLHISRGNASMNLRDLTEWGVIHRSRTPGDRKDLYHGDSDVLEMFARVVKERKRREIDPTVAVIRDCLEMLPPGDNSQEAAILRKRLSDLLEIFGLVDIVYSQVFGPDGAFRAFVESLQESTPDQNPKTKTDK